MIRINHARDVRKNKYGCDEQVDIVFLYMSPEDAMAMVAAMAKVVTPSHSATWQPRVEGIAHDGTPINGHLVIDASRVRRCESCGEKVKPGAGAEALRSLVCNPCDEEIKKAIESGRKARRRREKMTAPQAGEIDHE